MKYQKTIIFCFLFSFLGFYTYSQVFSGNSYVIEKERVYELDAEASEEELQRSISFASDDISSPEVCQEPQVFCSESTKITVKTAKTWSIIELPAITSLGLQPEEFAQYYPNLDPVSRITDGSPPQQKLILQRILYDRGLLPVAPTGKIGYETEKAIIKLQHIKGIVDEFDGINKVTIIGPQTINELNALKKRMQNKGYLEEKPLSIVIPQELPSSAQERLARIEELEEEWKDQPFSKQKIEDLTTPAFNFHSPVPIKYSGEATIEK